MGTPAGAGKDFRAELDPTEHEALARIARARGVTLQELGRRILREYIAQARHDAMVVLGIDPAPPESAGTVPESAGARRTPPRLR